jgi:hypothetical protein
MLPNHHKPWAKPVARIVICGTLIALGILTYYLQTHGSLHIPEIVGVFLLFLTIVPPNLAILYPWIMPGKYVRPNNTTHKSTAR